MTFQAWKTPILNSMTFQDVWQPCGMVKAASCNHCHLSVRLSVHLSVTMLL